MTILIVGENSGLAVNSFFAFCIFMIRYALFGVGPRQITRFLYPEISVLRILINCSKNRRFPRCCPEMHLTLYCRCGKA